MIGRRGFLGNLISLGIALVLPWRRCLGVDPASGADRSTFTYLKGAIYGYTNFPRTALDGEQWKALDKLRRDQARSKLTGLTCVDCNWQFREFDNRYHCLHKTYLTEGWADGFVCGLCQKEREKSHLQFEEMTDGSRTDTIPMDRPVWNQGE